MGSSTTKIAYYLIKIAGLLRLHQDAQLFFGSGSWEASLCQVGSGGWEASLCQGGRMIAQPPSLVIGGVQLGGFLPT